jgi:hypothetical protein
MRRPRVLLVARPRWALAALFEPQDLWCGWYWTTAWEGPQRWLHVYRCDVPTLVLKLSVRIGGAL